MPAYTLLDYDETFRDQLGREGRPDTGLGSGSNQKTTQQGPLTPQNHAAVMSGFGKPGGRVPITVVSARGRRRI